MGNKLSDGTHSSFNVFHRNDSGEHSHSRPPQSQSPNRAENEPSHVGQEEHHHHHSHHHSRERSTSKSVVAKENIQEGDELFKSSDYQKAKEKYEEALESLKEYADNSGHHHHHAAALTNLGVIEFAEGRYNEAKALLDEAVRKRRMLVHKDEFQPPNISSLSIALKKDRVFHKAPSAKIEMEAAMLKDHGTVDAMTAEVIGNLAMCCQKTGDLEEAKTLYEECLKLKKVIYGERSLQVADSLHSIASVLDAMCRPAEAEELLLESLSIEQQVYGEKSPETAVTLNNLGVMCVHNGEYAKALPFLELSHRIRRDAFGEDHHLTQVADKNLTFLRDKISAQGSSP